MMNENLDEWGRLKIDGLLADGVTLFEGGLESWSFKTLKLPILIMSWSFSRLTISLRRYSFPVKVKLKNLVKKVKFRLVLR